MRNLWLGLVPAAALLLSAMPGRADVVGETLEYTHDGTTFVGYLAYDDDTEGPRPGVLVVHEWYGLNDYARMRADQLAAMGYVALAADLYGGGQVGTTREEAGALAGSVRGTPKMRSRTVASFEVLRDHPLSDPERLAAIGFCFGGTAVLELAYSGAEVDGVVSFHGGLVAPGEADTVNGEILILHGADDPGVPWTRVTEVLQALDAKAAAWELVAYSDTVHAFTNPASGDDPSRGAAYSERATERAWAHMQRFLGEVLGA